MTKQDVAIIGAGFSGLLIAQHLKDFAKITLFDKARGVGGRMSSRTFENYTFDFGAQFFTAKNSEFKNYLQPYLKQEVIIDWQASFAEIDGNKISYQREWKDHQGHYIGSPKMNNLPKKIAQEISDQVEIKLQTRIAKIIKDKNKNILFDDQNNSLGEFDLVIIAIPIEQALELIPLDFHNISQLKTKEMLPCFALMIACDDELDLTWDCAYLKNSKLSWIALENKKPNRNQHQALTILSRNLWAKNNLERDIQEVKNELINEFELLIKKSLVKIKHIDIHRWRYANIARQNSNKFYFDQKYQIALAGDWCIHGRIEASFLSAIELVEFFKSYNC
jgi:renalase